MYVCQFIKQRKRQVNANMVSSYKEYLQAYVNAIHARCSQSTGNGYDVALPAVDDQQALCVVYSLF